MNVLVVFYSLEEHTKFIAGIIAKEIGADLLELKTEKEVPKTGFKKFFWGGKSVIFKEKPELQNEMPDLEKYDIVIIGTPIWAGTYAPPINSFISKVSIKQKKLAFFACHSGGGAKKCFEKLSRELEGNQILGSIDFVDPKVSDEKNITEQVRKWLSEWIR